MSMSLARTPAPSTRVGRRRRAAVHALFVATAIELSGAPSRRTSASSSPWASATAMTAALPRRTSSSRIVSTAIAAASRSSTCCVPTASPVPGVASDREAASRLRGQRALRGTMITARCHGSRDVLHPISRRALAPGAVCSSSFPPTQEAAMKRIAGWIGAMMLGVAATAAAQSGPVPIVGLVELSGPGAVSGTNFNDGVRMAVEEINAKGGILGRKIDYTYNDTQSNPGVAKALAQKAVDQNAYVVMGPVFSGSIFVSMDVTRKAEITNFTGGEAANITQQGNPYIFRTSFTQANAMPRVARYMKNALKLGADVSTDQGQVDFSGAVLKVKQSGSDGVFVYVNEEESARALRELAKQGYNKPRVGETTLTGQKVIELAGGAADGAIAHVGLSPDAPIPAVRAFAEKFQKEFKYKPDH